MSKYIKLEDAINNINLKVIGRKEYTVDMRANLFFALDDLPTIEFNKEGEWYNKEIWKNNDKGRMTPVEEWQVATCSVCGRYHTTPYEYYFDDFNYCPNCGAKMKG